MATTFLALFVLKSKCLFYLGNLQKQGKECQGWAGFGTRAGAYDETRAYVGAGDGTPSGSNPRGTIIFN